jgi:hypothetical protein
LVAWFQQLGVLTMVSRVYHDETFHAFFALQLRQA